MSTCAVLFAKKPAPGAVKTRLRSHLSARDAARLYEAMLLDCATALHATKAATKVVAFTPANAEDALRTQLTPIGTFEYVPQPEGRFRAADGGLGAVGLCAGGRASGPRRLG